MTLQTLSFLFGALLLLVGILGGGFEIKEVKIPQIPGVGRWIASFVGLIFVVVALWQPGAGGHGHDGLQDTGIFGSQARMSEMELDIDRPGGDLSPPTHPASNDPLLCEKECRLDPQCKAWTFVKPNTIGGPDPLCFLKRTVGDRKANPCCVSGYKHD
jgi:hypothetical protein